MERSGRPVPLFVSFSGDIVMDKITLIGAPLLGCLLAFPLHAQTSGVGAGSASGVGIMGTAPSAPPSGGNSKAGPCSDPSRRGRPECASVAARTTEGTESGGMAGGSSRSRGGNAASTTPPPGTSPPGGGGETR
jgi:hypothetical protein